MTWPQDIGCFCSTPTRVTILNPTRLSHDTPISPHPPTNLLPYCPLTTATTSISYTNFSLAKLSTPNNVLGGLHPSIHLTYLFARSGSWPFPPCNRSTTYCLTWTISCFDAPTALRHLSTLANARSHCSAKVGGICGLEGSEVSAPTWPAMEMRVDVGERGMREMWL